MTKYVLTIFAVAMIAAAEPNPVRVSIHVQNLNPEVSAEKLVRLLSKEIRSLEQVIVTDDSPDLMIWCNIVSVSERNGRDSRVIAYAAGIAVTTADGRMLGHSVEIDNSVDDLAHEVALRVDGAFIEACRRAKSAPTSSSFDTGLLVDRDAEYTRGLPTRLTDWPVSFRRLRIFRAQSQRSARPAFYCIGLTESCG